MNHLETPTAAYVLPSNGFLREHKLSIACIDIQENLPRRQKGSFNHGGQTLTFLRPSKDNIIDH